jgi:nucleoside 2-deoxyribosyltransferase
MNVDMVAEAIHKNGWANRVHYLASPYTNYPHGRANAAIDVASVAGELMKRGVVVFAPIVHGHAITEAVALPLDHAFWMRQCHAPFLGCASLIVAKLDGWDSSKGVTMEIGWAADLDMPTFHLDAPLMRHPRGQERNTDPWG